MKNNISFTALNLSTTVDNLKPANKDKLEVAEYVAARYPQYDFYVESNNKGEMQVTIERANPLDMLIYSGIAPVGSLKFHMIEYVKVMQECYNEIHNIKQKNYRETIPTEADLDNTEFILEDMINIFSNEIDDKQELN